MGNSTFDMHTLSTRSVSTRGLDRSQVFTNRTGRTDPALNPTTFKYRESVDSTANPNSTPVIIAVDETGSMGVLAENIIKRDLTTIVKSLYDNKPIPDPHILLAVVGDGLSDGSPIQATQFEADIVLMDQAQKFYLEGLGGGNNGESYALVWAFAANKVKADAFDKRHRKGYLFTVGDERTHAHVTKEEYERFLGVTVEQDVAVEHLLAQVKEHWHVYHLIVKTAATHQQNAEQAWKTLLGDNAVTLENPDTVGEMISALIQLNEGQSVADLTAQWDPIATARVAQALKKSGRKIEI